MTWGRYYWPWWLLALLITFLGPEIYSLAVSAGNSLSDWVWTTLKIVRNETIGQWSATDLLLFCAYVAIFMCWLPWHFFFHRFS